MWHDYPYTNFHEANQDWILRKIRELQKEMHDFEIVNQISFSGAWDITKQYPAWTIVSDNNIGYVSIQPVPAGILLTNGNYWREVIDYTAQIAGLQSRVVALENTVGDSSSGLVKDVNDLQVADVVINTNITNINKDISLLNNENVIFIGDSYGEAGSFVYPVWSEIVPTILSFNNVYTNCVSGVGFNTSTTFKDLLISLGGSITDKDSISTIYVFGGINDHSSSYADIDAAIGDFVSYAQANYINAKIKIGHVSMTTDGVVQYDMRFKTLGAYRNCTQYGAEYLNGIEYTLSDYTYLNPDGVHPTQAGQELLSRAIVECILNGNYDTNIRKTTTFSVALDSLYPADHTGATITLNGGIYELKSSNADGFMISSLTPFTLDTSGKTLLNVTNNAFPKGNGNMHKDITFRYKLNGEGTWDHIGIGRLTFDGVNNVIKLYSDQITISNVVGIAISGFEFRCGIFGY